MDLIEESNIMLPGLGLAIKGLNHVVNGAELVGRAAKEKGWDFKLNRKESEEES